MEYYNLPSELNHYQRVPRKLKIMPHHQLPSLIMNVTNYSQSQITLCGCYGFTQVSDQAKHDVLLDLSPRVSSIGCP